MLKVDAAQVESATSDTEPPEPELSPQQLLAQWEEAKTAELTANAKRISIEQQLALLVVAPEEGQKSVKFGPFKVTRTNSISYKGKLDQVLALAVELEIQSPLSKTVLDETALKRLRKSDPTCFDLLVDQGAVTFTHAKPNFVVARVPVAEAVTSCDTSLVVTN